MISNLQMITIYVSDLERALDFYTNKLGFVKLAEYDDGKDNHLIWVIPQSASKDDLATQIALQELADKKMIPASDQSAAWFLQLEPRKRSKQPITN